MTAIRTNGSTNHLTRAALVYSTVPFSMVLDCVAASTGVGMAQLNTVNIWNGHYLNYGANGWGAASVADNVFVASGAVAGTNNPRRQLVVGVWKSATSRQCFVDGRPGSINTTSSVPSVASDNLTVGVAKHDNILDNFCTLSAVYRIAVYRCALELGDIALLMRGTPLENIKPGRLVEGWYGTEPYLPGKVNPSESIPLPGVRGSIPLAQLSTDTTFPGRVPTVTTFYPINMSSRITSAIASVGSAFRRTLSPIGGRIGSRQVHRV